MSLVEAGGSAFFTDTSAYDLVYAGGLVWEPGWTGPSGRRSVAKRSMTSCAPLLTSHAGSEAAPAHTWSTSLALAVLRFADLGRKAQTVVCSRTTSTRRRFAELGVAVTLGPIRRNSICVPISRHAHRRHRYKDLAYAFGIRRATAQQGQWATVTNAAEIHTAWRNAQDDRVRVTLERGDEKIGLTTAAGGIRLRGGRPVSVRM